MTPSFGLLDSSNTFQMFPGLPYYIPRTPSSAHLELAALKALHIISNYEEILRQPAQDGESWECEECNKVNPDTFELCWSCQANRMTVA